VHGGVRIISDWSMITASTKLLALIVLARPSDLIFESFGSHAKQGGYPE